MSHAPTCLFDVSQLISNDASYALLSNQHNESRNGVFTSIFDCISYVVRQVLLSNLPTTQYPQYLQHLYLCKIITAVFHLDIPPRGARRGHEGRFVSLLVYFARCGSTAGWRLAGYSPLLPCSFLSPFSVFLFWGMLIDSSRRNFSLDCRYMYMCSLFSVPFPLLPLF